MERVQLIFQVCSLDFAEGLSRGAYVPLPDFDKRTSHATEPYLKALRKRSVWVEPLFAEGKDWHETLPLTIAVAREL
jgi:hypothetical protein